MRLALFLDHKKRPLKRADITAKVLPGHKGSQLTSQLIAEVSASPRRVHSLCVEHKRL
jgi:hypothetical protein